MSLSIRQQENYTVGPTLSQGKFAAVRECRHKMTGQEYSLRVIRKAGVFGQEDLIVRECEVWQCLKHDNLVMVVDGWETSDDIFMVVEHVEVRLFHSVTVRGGVRESIYSVFKPPCLAVCQLFGCTYVYYRV